MKITRLMVAELNAELRTMGCPFRYRFEEERYSYSNPRIEIILPSMNYVDSFMVHPTEEFFTWLYAWFEAKGIELSCNNTGSILWSKNGWDL